MKTTKIISICMFVGATAAQAQTASEGLYPVNTTVRDYAKRDRLLIGGLEYVSPSQLHENAGLRARFEGEVQNSELRKQGSESKLSTPAINAGVAYGWQSFTLGLQASFLSAENDGSEAVSVTEEFESRKVMPELAYTFGQNFTAGIGLEIAQLDVSEQLGTTNDFTFDYQRPIVGLAYHTPKWEVGVAYTGEVQEKDQLSADAQREGTLSLAQTASINERDIYLPSMGTLYARGNLTDNFSLMSSVSLARYDGNVDGAVGLFEKYENQDRLAAKLLGTYWTSARSRVSLAAEYKGAATTAVGAEESGLGYRLANLYGGTLEGVLAINRQTYLGLNASFMRGERDDLEPVSGVNYTAREESARFAGSVTVKL